MYAAAIAAAVVATAIAVFVAVLILDNDLVALVAAELAAFDFEADCEAEAMADEAMKADELAPLGFAEDEGLTDVLTACELELEIIDDVGCKVEVDDFASVLEGVKVEELSFGAPEEDVLEVE